MLYAIGDIHGQLDALENALSLIKDDGGANATIVFLGDYTDRGPNSCGVIERLIEGKQSSKSWYFLKGNHDRMFSWYLKLNPIHDPHLFHGLHWLHPRMGGENTLLSYGVTVDQERRSGEIHSEARQKIPKTHVNFLNSLDLMYRTSDLAFVHAGIRPGVKLDEQKEHILKIQLMNAIDKGGNNSNGNHHSVAAGERDSSSQTRRRKRGNKQPASRSGAAKNLRILGWRLGNEKGLR